MNSLRDKRIAQKRKILISISLAFILLFVLAKIGTFSFLGKGLHRFALPVWTAGNTIHTKLQLLAGSFASKQSILKQNQILQNKLTEYGARILDRDILYTENLALKAELGRKSNTSFVLGVVLTKPNRSPYDTIIVDIGADTGIAVDDQVFVFGNILVGKVVEVYPHSAKVSFFSTPGTKITGRISGSAIDVELIGRGGGNFETTIPRDVAVTEGTPIVFPSLTPYVIGTIAKNLSDSRDPFAKLLIISPVNIQESQFVEVLKK